MRHQCHLSILYYLHCGNSLTPNKPSNFPSTMGKLGKLSKKRKAAARKAKAAADAAAAADTTTAATAASAATDAAADAASCAAAAAVVPAAPSGSGLSSASNRLATHRSYAAAVANDPAVAGETTSVNAATVASPSSAATRSSKKLKLSAAVVVPAATADHTGDTTAPDLLTKDLKKKSPKKSGNIAATVEPGATDTSVPSKSRYPSRGTDTMTSTGKCASSSPVAEDDAHPFVPAGKAPKTAAS